MAYKHKFVVGENYAFYNNADDLETNANFTYWGFDLVHSDTFTSVYDDVTTLSKDIISGSDYRWYADSFEFPSVPTGCYRFIILDTTDNSVLYISNEIEVTDSTDGLVYCKYRNAKNKENYNYETLTDFYNLFHVELKRRKPLNPKVTQGYDLSTGSFKRVRTTKTKTYEFVTGWFDEDEHDAMQDMVDHSDLQLVYEGNFNAMNWPDDSEYAIEWQEDYEFIQASIRLEQNDKSTSYKAV
jgi:hypothetical protein